MTQPEKKNSTQPNPTTNDAAWHRRLFFSAEPLFCCSRCWTHFSIVSSRYDHVCVHDDDDGVDGHYADSSSVGWLADRPVELILRHIGRQRPLEVLFFRSHFGIVLVVLMSAAAAAASVAVAVTAAAVVDSSNQHGLIFSLLRGTCATGGFIDYCVVCFDAGRPRVVRGSSTLLSSTLLLPTSKPAVHGYDSPSSSSAFLFCYSLVAQHTQ